MAFEPLPVPDLQAAYLMRLNPFADPDATMLLSAVDPTVDDPPMTTPDRSRPARRWALVWGSAVVAGLGVLALGGAVTGPAEPVVSAAPSDPPDPAPATTAAPDPPAGAPPAVPVPATTVPVAVPAAAPHARPHARRAAPVRTTAPRATPHLALPRLTTRAALPPRTRVPAAVRFRGCQEARKAGVAPLRVGSPGYSRALDTDKDGIACD